MKIIYERYQEKDSIKTLIKISTVKEVTIYI